MLRCVGGPLGFSLHVSGHPSLPGPALSIPPSPDTPVFVLDAGSSPLAQPEVSCFPLSGTDPTVFCLPFQSGLFPHPLSGRCLEQSLHAQHVQPEIAGQDTRAVSALTMAQGEKKGRCLGIRGEALWFARGAWFW